VKNNSNLLSLNWFSVYAVWRRHLTVYRATWLSNFLPPMTEPVFYLFGFGLGLNPIIGKVNYLGHEIEYLKFIAPGMIGVAVLLQAFFEAAYGSFIRLQYQKTWQAILTTPTSYSDLFLGELFWAATKGIIAGLLTSLVIIIAGLAQLSDLLLFIPLVLLSSILFASLGLLVIGLINKIDEINLPVFLLVIPMSVMAGTYYPRTNLPIAIERVVSQLPLSALVDILRFNIAPHTDWWVELMKICLWLFLLITLAWLSIHRKLFK